MDQLCLSGRALHRLLKVSRTIADLTGNETTEALRVSEAVQYRSLDHSYWCPVLDNRLTLWYGGA